MIAHGVIETLDMLGTLNSGYAAEVWIFPHIHALREGMYLTIPKQFLVLSLHTSAVVAASVN